MNTNNIKRCDFGIRYDDGLFIFLSGFVAPEYWVFFHFCLFRRLLWFVIRRGKYCREQSPQMQKREDS